VSHIEVGDILAIDSAYSISESWAAGRPGTAGTSFLRRVCGVHIKDLAPDQHPHVPDPPNVDPNDPTHPQIDPTGGSEVNKTVDFNGCADPGVPVEYTVWRQAGMGDGTQPLVDILNRALGSRGRASLPQPDGPLSQGSPGGYIASLEKDRLQQISSRAVNGDISTEVPALELTVFNDDQTEGRGRQIYQFAGTDASSTYAIYLLNPGDNFCTTCFTPQPPPAPVIAIPPVAPPTIAPYTPPPPGPAGPITILFRGIGFLLHKPLDALLAAAVWALLYSPMQLATRRRALRTG
jgi:hypothetical protein